MFEWVFSLDAWLVLITLCALEIVLGVDNVIFLAILVAKLPPHLRNIGRILGLSFAMLTRILLLISLFWVMKLVYPLFTLFNQEISGRDLILFFGGLFLIYNATREIIEQVHHTPNEQKLPKGNALWLVVTQIALLDIVFSLDSVITAVGIAKDIEIMILAVIIAVGVMFFASKPIADFVEVYVNIKILALVFLAMIGGVLLAESLDIHIPKAYIYVAMAFSLIVEFLNIYAFKKLGKNIKKDT